MREIPIVTTDAKVSKLPWKVSDKEHDRMDYATGVAASTRAILCDKHLIIATTVGDGVPEGQANAAFIVLAANAHEPLVRLLIEARDILNDSVVTREPFWMEEMRGTCEALVAKIDDASAALRLAKEGGA